MENPGNGRGQPAVEPLLSRAETVILTPEASEAAANLTGGGIGEIFVGVDLGTAYLVCVALNENRQPVAGEYQFAQVARDGLVVDFIGAVDRLKEMKKRLERRLGQPLDHAASGFPPGVPAVEVRATAHVVEAAGMRCTAMIDEPSAANAVLGLENGTIVDVGGGTTGIAVIESGQVVYTADEPTGGTHFSLVIAGALDIPFEEAEALKISPSEQPRLLPLVRPVMEKVASIVYRHLNGRPTPQIILVGGASAFLGFPQVVAEYTGLPTTVPERPLFITPLGIAMADGRDQRRETAQPA